MRLENGQSKIDTKHRSSYKVGRYVYTRSPMVSRLLPLKTGQTRRRREKVYGRIVPDDGSCGVNEVCVRFQNGVEGAYDMKVLSLVKSSKLNYTFKRSVDNKLELENKFAAFED